MSTLSVERSFTAPLPEVSGLAVQRIPGRPPRLLAVSDSSFDIAVAELGQGAALELEVHETGRLFDGHRGSQWEAVTCDDVGRVLLLEEDPGSLFVLDPTLSTRLATVHLEPGELPAAEGWDNDPGSRGEGMVLLATGHLLVLKEKEPTRLLELGPTGDAPGALTPGGEARFADGSTLTILACWEVEGGSQPLGDLSELAVGPDGALYVLGDREGVLARLGPLPVGGGKVGVAARWNLPDEVTSPERKKGKKKDKDKRKNEDDDSRGKPEGLVILDGMRPLVAIDRRKADDVSLFLLEALR